MPRRCETSSQCSSTGDGDNKGRSRMRVHSGGTYKCIWIHDYHVGISELSDLLHMYCKCLISDTSMLALCSTITHAHIPYLTRFHAMQMLAHMPLPAMPYHAMPCRVMRHASYPRRCANSRRRTSKCSRPRSCWRRSRTTDSGLPT